MRSARARRDGQGRCWDAYEGMWGSVGGESRLELGRRLRAPRMHVESEARREVSTRSGEING